MTVTRNVFPVELKIRYKGLFDWAGIYKLVYNWIVNRQFRFHEKRYKDKLDTPLGNELEVDVWGEKEVTEYYKYRMDVAYHLWESREIPVVINGKQTKLWQGRIEIKISGKVITDWQGHYKSGENTVHKWMEMFLNKVVLKNEIEMKHIDPFDKDLHRLEAELKKLLKIEADASGVG
jgi:hypothetical protein